MNENTEYALKLSGGSMQVRSNDPEIEEIYPIEKWIENQKKQRMRIYKRTISIIEDWEEV